MIKRIFYCLFVLVLTVSSASAARVSLAWDSNGDNSTGGYLLHYGLSSGNYQHFVDAGLDTSIEVANLNRGQTYYFAATAYDSSGELRSAYSNEVVFTVPDGSDSEAPSAPASVNLVRVAKNMVQIAWPAARDNVAVTAYEIRRNGNFVTRTASRGYIDRNLSPRTAYIYSVAALDASLNMSQFTSATAVTNKFGNTNSRPSNSSTRDSDGDGVTDAQEYVDGTNPFDRGSIKQVLGSTVCAEWNGFLGMANILEHVNMTSSPLRVETVLYDGLGIERERLGFMINPGAQFDVLVHDMGGFQRDAYGKICSSHFGSTGALDGRMVYYKLEDNFGPIEFAFAMPFINGTAGSQLVPFNTYQPSLRGEDVNDLVANWIQITNLETSTEGGLLTFYDGFGEVLGAVYAELAPGARQDFSAHQFGPQIAGQVEWVPTSTTAKFQVRNVRYLTDNPFGAPSFDSAFQLEGATGSGSELVAPIDNTPGQSAVVEVLNVLDQPVSTTVRFFNESGTLVAEFVPTLSARGSMHFIASTYLPGARGTVTVQGDEESSARAVVMQYGYASDGALSTLYGIEAVEPLGSSLRSSYNTFLNQECDLVLVNGSDSSEQVRTILTGAAGNTVHDFGLATIPAKGVLVQSVCDKDVDNTYGVVTVTAETNSVSGQIIRLGDSNTYRFPSPMRE